MSECVFIRRSAVACLDDALSAKLICHPTLLKNYSVVYVPTENSLILDQIMTCGRVA